MPRRTISPAPSDGEVDIFDSIFNGNETSATGKGKDDLDDVDEILNGNEDAEDDGDEAFIALQQAASYRKASNLKGKSVKKGGGFQAMGWFNIC
jgi:ATP-dependent RNA helicase DDX54/DBP10